MTTNEKELLQIGRVLKPRGLRGELKIQILTNRPSVFMGQKTVWIGRREYAVRGTSFHSGFAYIFLDGIDKIEKAEVLKGKAVEVPRECFELADDEVLDIDLIGFTVVTENGKTIGVLETIENDNLVVGDTIIPNEDDFVIETNMKTKQIIIRNSFFDAEEIR
ncbi:MAG: ribosome maturation factor RimM [Firmicutes bacterium]|nr:ribosome maturation factor RimM [Bacillota bacterium]